MALVDSSGFDHVCITVTDIERSKAFYDQVFGWPTAVDASDRAGEAGIESSPEKFYGGRCTRLRRDAVRTPAGGF